MSNRKDWTYLGQYLHYLMRYKRWLWAAIGLVPLIPLSQLAQPYLIQVGIDQHVVPQVTDGLSVVVIAFGVAVVVEFLAKSLQIFLFQYLGQQTVSDIRYDLFKHVLGLSSTYFDKTPQGSITTRLTTDIEALNDSIASGLVSLLSDILTIVGTLGLMVWYSPKLTLITLLVVPPLAMMVNFFRKKLRYYFVQIRSIIGKVNASLQEQLLGVRVIQMFGRIQRNAAAMRHDLAKYRAVTIGSVVYDAMLYSLVEAMSSVMIGVMIWVGFSLDRSVVSLGVVVAFVDLILKFFTPLKELSSKFATLQHALAALEKIFGLLDITDRVSSGVRQLYDYKGVVTFKEVSFAYRGFEDKPVLHEVSFEVKPGEVVAIVGPTGSGKTTISRLVARLYDGYSGHIMIDRIDVCELELTHLRQKIAIVTQDVQVFSQSVWYNLGLEHPDVSEATMRDVAKRVGLDEMICALPDGYDTVLDHQGRALSAGQAQLLSLARALASPAPIVVLDEATANVDSLSEQQIQAAIAEIFKEKTVIVIAHRLSTIQKADMIVAMRDGRVTESGTHSELMANGGFYATLYSMQFSHLNDR